ncbi:MAG: hypothetical protein ACOX8O_02195 [Christensenellales bacterium]|jgi:hypothetical protein
MIDCCKMYMILFHSITDVLIRAQQAAEELYIPPNRPCVTMYIPV